jgi:rod shape-determining protein MreC
MENLITRYRNVSFLVGVLFTQVLVLGVQVKRTEENRSTRLIRVWAVDAITPFEKAIVRIQRGGVGLWREYFYLRGVRQENRDLKQQIEHMQLEQVRLKNDADQARRLQRLLGFKEQFISQVLAAQVIGSSGSEHSRVIYIDKGTSDGIDKDMPVITADGVIGKVLHVFGSSSEVLLIDDQSSGVGTILEQSRLQGVLKGTPGGEVVLDKVMNDEQVQTGERVLTSGGDEIFPKGLLVGTVAKATHGPESFLAIRIKPAADLGRLEEVLVITKQEERSVEVAGSAPRAVDILALRLPSVPEKKPDEKINDKNNNKDQKDQASVNPAAGAQHASGAAALSPDTSRRANSGASPQAPKSGIHNSEAAGIREDGAKSSSSANAQATPESTSPERKATPSGDPEAAPAQPGAQTKPGQPLDQPQ